MLPWGPTGGGGFYEKELGRLPCGSGFSHRYYSGVGHSLSPIWSPPSAYHPEIKEILVFYLGQIALDSTECPLLLHR